MSDGVEHQRRRNFLSMKIIKLPLLLWFICTIFSCHMSSKIFRDSDRNKLILDSAFTIFNTLDSAANLVIDDTIVSCCRGGISFMERTTKIPPSSPGTFLGRFYFTKSDLQKWHTWYEENRFRR